jgi:quinol monooxygenase YgiN
MTTEIKINEVKLFQVKPDKLSEFETFIVNVVETQKKQHGCLDIKYVNRFLL